MKQNLLRACLMCGRVRHIKHLSKHIKNKEFHHYYCNDNPDCKNVKLW